MPQQPNILLITSDQQHYSCLGSLNPVLQTPALDRLEREGVRFDRAYRARVRQDAHREGALPARAFGARTGIDRDCREDAGSRFLARISWPVVRL